MNHGLLMYQILFVINGLWIIIYLSWVFLIHVINVMISSVENCFAGFCLYPREFKGLCGSSHVSKHELNLKASKADQ